MITLRLFVPALALVAVAPRSTTPRFAVEEKTTLTKTFETKLAFESDSFHLFLDDEEAPAGQSAKVDLKITDTKRTVLADTYTKVADGRATAFDRRYEEAGSKGTEDAVATIPGVDEPKKTSTAQERTTVFTGKSVRFSWDAKGEAWKTEWIGDGADAKLLDGLRGETDLIGYLPEHDVEEGKSWELDAKLFGLLDDPAGDLKLAVEGAEEDPMRTEIASAIDENMKGKAKATWRGVREVEGKKLGVLEIEAKVASHAEAQDEEHGLGRKIEIEYDLSGEILWDLAGGHAASYDISGPVKTRFSQSRTVDTQKGKHTIRQEFELHGDVKNTLAVK